MWMIMLDLMAMTAKWLDLDVMAMMAPDVEKRRAVVENLTTYC